MRIFYLFLCFICLCDLLHAQTVRIAYEGDPLTDKERRKIEQALQYEVEFYKVQTECIYPDYKRPSY